MLENGCAAVLPLISLALPSCSCSPWFHVWVLPSRVQLTRHFCPLDFVDKTVFGVVLHEEVHRDVYFLVLASGWFPTTLSLTPKRWHFFFFYTVLFYFLALVTTSFSSIGAWGNSGNLLIPDMVVISTQPTCTFVF